MRWAGPAAFGAGWLLGSRRRRGTPRQGGTVKLRGRPDGRRRPSDGIVAEASIVARLLRLRLLTLDATVLVSPAEVVKAQPPGARPVHPRAFDGRAPGRALARPVGGRLAEAARTVDESAATLAATRHAAGRAG